MSWTNVWNFNKLERNITKADKILALLEHEIMVLGHVKGSNEAIIELLASSSLECKAKHLLHDVTSSQNTFHNPLNNNTTAHRQQQPSQPVALSSRQIELYAEELTHLHGELQRSRKTDDNFDRKAATKRFNELIGVLDADEGFRNELASNKPMFSGNEYMTAEIRKIFDAKKMHSFDDDAFDDDDIELGDHSLFETSGKPRNPKGNQMVDGLPAVSYSRLYADVISDRVWLNTRMNILKFVFNSFSYLSSIVAVLLLIRNLVL